MKPNQILLTLTNAQLVELANVISQFRQLATNYMVISKMQTELLLDLDEKLERKIQTLTEQQPNPNQLELPA